MRRNSRQSLVHQAHVGVQVGRKRSGEIDGVTGGCRVSARKCERKSDDNFESSEFCHNPGDPQAIRTIFGACDRLDRRGQHAVQIGTADADPHLADIDADPHT